MLAGTSVLGNYSLFGGTRSKLRTFWGGTSKKKNDELKWKEPLRDGVDENPLYGHLRNSDVEELRDVNGYYAGPLDP